MKKKFILAFTMSAAFAIGTLGMTNMPKATASSYGDMKKVVQYYKKGKMKKAKKEAKKLPKTVSYGIPIGDDYKELYLEVIEETSDIQEMYLCDYDEDTDSELFIKHGTCEADMVLDCYDIFPEDDEYITHLMWSVNASNSTVHNYYGCSGIILMSGIQGYEEMHIVDAEGKETTYSRDVGTGSYFNPRCKMKRVKKSYFK